MKILKEIMFADDKHKQIFDIFCSRVNSSRLRSLDCYYYPVLYLLSLDEVLRNHALSVFDFEEGKIIPEGLNCPWQTGTSLKTTRLLFSLWNGYASDGEMYTDAEGYQRPLPSNYYAPDEIFSCSYAPYYCEALRLRFPCYFE